MHPFFFSVSGEDTPFADAIWQRLASDQIYLYPKSGPTGARFWDEVERDELPFAKAAVIFWSSSFLKNKGTPTLPAQS